MQNRLKSWALWLAIGALVLDVCVFQGAITLSDSQTLQGFYQRLLEIVAAAGIINNPTNSNGL